ncbi:MAG TPA: hypothetical protein IAA30_00780 [Candidatus Treponema faecavium]|nr:hypothetical protein [Candidatus Treponema faecavium]
MQAAAVLFLRALMRICRRQKISHLKNKNLPITNKKFAVYPATNLPTASGALADGKFVVCRRQSKSLPIANGSLADGKIHSG